MFRICAENSVDTFESMALLDLSMPRTCLDSCIKQQRVNKRRWFHL